ncbi:MAG TPA: SPASM domain-containing protein [Planctomycetota bacterium]|nr:SPASM domain-containing protein [Planctomycetota bacterium]HRR81182.1 SPASM domain-containing protein [Planctomycetota bacterium]HRT95657.1 SPASM domain-containing protein [Planctomycetota bacterium]
MLIEMLPPVRREAVTERDAEPRKAYVELTTACNLDCPMCLRRAFEEPGGEMALATFRRVVEQCAELPARATLSFGGYGEPMAHPLFAEFLALAKGARLQVEAVSNGLLLTPERMQQLLELRLDKLIVSLDGVSGDASQNLHAGTFPEVAERLREFHRLRLARRAERPEVVVEFVATKRNIAELPALVRLAPHLGFTGVVVTNLVPHTPELAAEVLYEQWATPARRHLATPWDPVVELPLLDARSAASAVAERLRGAGARLWINGADVSGAGPRCRFVAEGRLAIRWDGAVSPCLPLLHSHTYYFRDKAKRLRRYALGNVNDARLRELWGGAEYRAFRARVREFAFAPCIECGGCDLRSDNEEDCFGDDFPRCGECLWAAGLVQCP